jgi:hypothetical protein
MSYEQKPNTGSLFKNDKRESDSHPHATGSAVIDGVAYWVSAWTKDKDGKKWQSLAFKPKDAKKAPEAARGVAAQDPDDEIPF